MSALWLLAGKSAYTIKWGILEYGSGFSLDSYTLVKTEQKHMDFKLNFTAVYLEKRNFLKKI